MPSDSERKVVKVNDYQGRIVPEPSPLEIVKVWEIEPHRDCGYSHCVVMGWQEMHEVLSDIATAKLEAIDEEDLREGLTIKVKLVDMVYGDYLDTFEN